MKKKMNVLKGIAFIAVAVTLIACKKETIVNPASEPTLAVVNDIDNLSVAVSQMEGYSASKTYSYSGSVPTHGLNVGTQITSGSIVVTVTNSLGQQLYNSTFSSYFGAVESLNDANFPWTVVLNFQNTSGQIGFVISKEE